MLSPDDLCISSTDKILFRIPQLFSEFGDFLLRRAFDLEVVAGFSFVQRNIETVPLKDSPVFRVLDSDFETNLLENTDHGLCTIDPALDFLAMFQF